MYVKFLLNILDHWFIVHCFIMTAWIQSDHIVPRLIIVHVDTKATVISCAQRAFDCHIMIARHILCTCRFFVRIVLVLPWTSWSPGLPVSLTFPSISFFFFFGGGGGMVHSPRWWFIQYSFEVDCVLIWANECIYYVFLMLFKSHQKNCLTLEPIFGGMTSRARQGCCGCSLNFEIMVFHTDSVNVNIGNLRWPWYELEHLSMKLCGCGTSSVGGALSCWSTSFYGDQRWNEVIK